MSLCGPRAGTRPGRGRRQAACARGRSVCVRSVQTSSCRAAERRGLPPPICVDEMPSLASAHMLPGAGSVCRRGSENRHRARAGATESGRGPECASSRACRHGAQRGKERCHVSRGAGSDPPALACRHQRLYSLLDRLRLATAPGSRGPSPPVTAHPLDGDGLLALDTVSPDKVSVRHVHV